MIRIEIIADNAVEDDIMEALKENGVGSCFTKIPVAHGEGDSTPKHGNHIWPEENFILVIYCERDEAESIRGLIREVKLQFPNEGIKLFEIESAV
ncbi:MAG: hypothetical protein JEY99_07795 [Spirochaetales bacterium]|nr:hypothetical protein [Spirochaetales bacterium]